MPTNPDLKQLTQTISQHTILRKPKTRSCRHKQVGQTDCHIQDSLGSYDLSPPPKNSRTIQETKTVGSIIQSPRARDFLIVGLRRSTRCAARTGVGATVPPTLPRFFIVALGQVVGLLELVINVRSPSLHFPSNSPHVSACGRNKRIKHEKKCTNMHDGSMERSLFSLCILAPKHARICVI